jgi:hypothetical protein
MAAAADGDLSCPRGYSCQHTTSSKDKDKDRTICCTATDRLEREQQKDKKKKKNSAKKNGTTTSAEKSAPQTEPPKIISTTNSTTKDLSKSQQVKSRPGSTKSNELQVINCLPNEILVDGVCVYFLHFSIKFSTIYIL